MCDPNLGCDLQRRCFQRPITTIPITSCCYVMVKANSVYDMNTHMYNMMQVPGHPETHKAEHDPVTEYVNYSADIFQGLEGIATVRVTMSIKSLARESTVQHAHTGSRDTRTRSLDARANEDNDPPLKSPKKGEASESPMNT